MKRSVRELIHQRRLQHFSTVTPDTPIFETLNVLERTQSSAVLVVEGGRLRGIFSEKDFARSLMNRGLQLTDMVKAAMTANVYYAEPDFTLEECLQIMSKAHVRHLPVLEDGKPIALVSMRHIMEVLVEDKEAQIRDLTAYITGHPPVDFTGTRRPTTNRIPVLKSSQNRHEQEAI